MTLTKHLNVVMLFLRIKEKKQINNMITFSQGDQQAKKKPKLKTETSEYLMINDMNNNQKCCFHPVRLKQGRFNKLSGH